jgi:hypothetical protein
MSTGVAWLPPEPYEQRSFRERFLQAHALHSTGYFKHYPIASREEGYTFRPVSDPLSGGRERYGVRDVIGDFTIYEGESAIGYAQFDAEEKYLTSEAYRNRVIPLEEKFPTPKREDRAPVEKTRRGATRGGFNLASAQTSSDPLGTRSSLLSIGGGFGSLGE